MPLLIGSSVSWIWERHVLPILKTVKTVSALCFPPCVSVTAGEWLFGQNSIHINLKCNLGKSAEEALLLSSGPAALSGPQETQTSKPKVRPDECHKKKRRVCVCVCVRVKKKRSKSQNTFPQEWSSQTTQYDHQLYNKVRAWCWYFRAWRRRQSFAVTQNYERGLIFDLKPLGNNGFDEEIGTSVMPLQWTSGCRQLA